MEYNEQDQDWDAAALDDEALGVWHADEVGACLGLLRLLALLRSLKHFVWRYAREATVVPCGAP